MVDAAKVAARATSEKHPKLNTDLFFAACRAKGAVTDVERAELFGLTRKAVFRYVKGEVTPGLGKAQQIAARLDLTVDELWDAA